MWPKERNTIFLTKKWFLNFFLTWTTCDFSLSHRRRDRLETHYRPISCKGKLCISKLVGVWLGTNWLPKLYIKHNSTSTVLVKCGELVTLQRLLWDPLKSKCKKKVSANTKEAELTSSLLSHPQQFSHTGLQTSRQSHGNHLLLRKNVFHNPLMSGSQKLLGDAKWN